jgi:hypothetical protein
VTTATTPIASILDRFFCVARWWFRSLSAGGRDLLVPPFASRDRDVLLVCDQAGVASLLVEPPSCDAAPLGMYLDFIAGILERSDLNILFHRKMAVMRGFAAATGTENTIERWCDRLSVAGRERLRVIEAVPLDYVLPYADLLVSFASPALVRGCRHGLKPIQIGQRLVGSEAFAYFFPTMEAALEAILHRLDPRLSLDEYDAFESFRAAMDGPVATTGRPVVCRLANASAPLTRDLIMQEFRALDGPRITPLGAIAGTLANPFAVYRLLFGPAADLNQDRRKRSFRSAASAR